MEKKGNQYRVQNAIEAMKNLVRAYFHEANWFHEGSIPTMEEYMRIALVTSGYYMLTTMSFIGMGEIVTKEAFDWVISDPKIITASAVICRLMDDISSHKFEQKRGHVASGIECYMKQYGASEEEAYDEFQKQVVDAWRDINEEFLRPTVVPMPLLMRVLNLSRVMDVIYTGGDGYTHVGKVMKNNVASLLIHPIPRFPNPKIVLANFHPNIWGDQFITCTPEDYVTRACKEEQIEDLKKEVKRELTVVVVANPSQLLNFIDAYHFEQEIEEALQQICNSFHDCNDMDGDLYNIALGFRLLRQQGYSISCCILNKFTDE
ncbi:unnamed protein product, partial [Vitis vinifera]